eukprot:30168-Prorocentrum_minimum.AAC.1
MEKAERMRYGRFYYRFPNGTVQPSKPKLFTLIHRVKIEHMLYNQAVCIQPRDQTIATELALP